MIIYNCKKELPELLREFLAFHGFDILLGLVPGGHDLMAAAQTPQAEICAGAQHQPFLLPAGMGFLHHQNII